jgi:hypothetical protein
MKSGPRHKNTDGSLSPIEWAQGIQGVHKQPTWRMRNTRKAESGQSAAKKKEVSIIWERQKEKRVGAKLLEDKQLGIQMR